MAKTKETEARETINAHFAETWSDGYRKGTKEGMEWCIQVAMELEEKAETSPGKEAMRAISALMRRDLERRQPSRPSSGE